MPITDYNAKKRLEAQLAEMDKPLTQEHKNRLQESGKDYPAKNHTGGLNEYEKRENLRLRQEFEREDAERSSREAAEAAEESKRASSLRKDRVRFITNEDLK